MNVGKRPEYCLPLIPKGRNYERTWSLRNHPLCRTGQDTGALCVLSRRRLSCQAVGPGPDWSAEWIFTSLISATANRLSSKGEQGEQGRERGKTALRSLYLDSAARRWWISAPGLMARQSANTPQHSTTGTNTHRLVLDRVAGKHTHITTHTHTLVHYSLTAKRIYLQHAPIG